MDVIQVQLLKAITARCKSYCLSHYSITKWSKHLQKLKGKYAGKRCFIIGNGPSLSPEDLDKLVDEYTFAFNRIYYIFDKTAWRPTFYCTQDDKIAVSSIAEINSRIDTPYVFVPINLKWYYGIDLHTKYFFNQRQPKSETECPEFSEDIHQWIGVGNTVVYTAMQLAVYMGFTEIYLIGVDHSFHTYQDQSGNIITDPAAKDYFCAEYNKDRDRLFIPKLDVSTLSYLAAQKYAMTHPVTIYNATRGGKLEVFPRVDFDSLFN